MKSFLSAVHPDLQKFAKNIPRFTIHARNLWLFRLLGRLPVLSKKPEGVQIENISIPGQAHNERIRLRVYRPDGLVPSAPVLVWLHGGGYLIGRPEQDDGCCIQYARELGILVVSVDYRFAPEHPFPAGLEDSYTTLKWVAAQAGPLGVEPDRIAIGGESAGGGLAAALAQLAHDRKEIRPVCQLLVYPMLDDRTCLRPGISDQNTLTWTLESNRFGWESYLGAKCGSAGLPPYSVPAHREDLSGLPPAWIGVGTLDLFHLEDVAYGQSLRDCGVECETVVVPGGFHGFDLAGLHLQVVRDFRNSQIAALKRRLFSEK